MDTKKIAEQIVADSTSYGTPLFPSVGIRGFKRYVREYADKLDRSLPKLIEVMDKGIHSEEDRRDLLSSFQWVKASIENLQDELDKMHSSVERLSELARRASIGEEDEE